MGPFRGRTLPGLVNVAGAIAVLVVVASLALRAAQSTTPAVAEFAPQAQQIRQAPQEQALAGRSSTPGPGLQGGPATPSPSPSSATVPNGARLLSCVGDPPRQIEDAQSPPCVPFWQGQNGGATSRGVNATGIRVAVPCGSTATTGDSRGYVYNGFPDFVKFFNRRFELYGRQVQPVCEAFPNSGDAATQRSAADQVAADAEFASVGSPNSDAATDYYDELAKDRVVVAVDGWASLTEPWLAARDPYTWQYEMANDQEFGNLGEWACRWLVGRPAKYAGDPTLQARTRSFAIVFTQGNSGDPASAQPLKTQLASCGAGQLAADIEYPGADATQDAQSAAIELASSHATTVFCLPEYMEDCVSVRQAATRERFFPEWILTSYGYSDHNAPLELYQDDRTQLAHTFGVTFEPRQIRPAEQPWWSALSEVDPTQANDHTAEMDWEESLQYRNFLLLMSGIQLAGPRLTPSALAAGLQRAVFPNPTTAAEEGAVGFAGGRHSMTVDAAVWWWSNTAQSPYSDEQAGSICYVDGGARHPDGRWPAPSAAEEQQLFGAACDSGA
jgi:hypothetical protein